MATTDLALDEQGTLPKPGPFGRLARLAFGVLCCSYVYGLWTARGSLVSGDGSIRPLLWNGILAGLFLVSYVVNIGFSRSWKNRPALASVALLLGVASVNYLSSGAVGGHLSAMVLHSWLLYVFGHLGLAFLLSALIGTPGCEMRALHHLYSLMTGRPTKEHHCPVGSLRPIDQWEAARR